MNSHVESVISQLPAAPGVSAVEADYLDAERRKHEAYSRSAAASTSVQARVERYSEMLSTATTPSGRNHQDGTPLPAIAAVSPSMTSTTPAISGSSPTTKSYRNAARVRSR